MEADVAFWALLSQVHVLDEKQWLCLLSAFLLSRALSPPDSMGSMITCRGVTAEPPRGCQLGWLDLSCVETLISLVFIADSVLPSSTFLAYMALLGVRALAPILPVFCSLKVGSENSPGSGPGEKSPSQNTKLQLRRLLREHKIRTKRAGYSLGVFPMCCCSKIPCPFQHRGYFQKKTWEGTSEIGASILPDRAGRAGRLLTYSSYSPKASAIAALCITGCKIAFHLLLVPFASLAS